MLMLGLGKRHMAAKAVVGKKNDQEEAFERCLTASLARVVEFLKFAEAKNAALLTFSSAWLLAALAMLSSGSRSPIESLAAAIAAVIFAGAALCAISSFLPRVKLDALFRDPERPKALLFFGDAATFEPSAYRERVRQRYFPPEGHSATEGYLDDLAVQIVVVSGIVTRKFKLFNWAAFAVGAGLLFMLCPAIIRLCALVRVL